MTANVFNFCSQAALICMKRFYSAWDTTSNGTGISRTKGLSHLSTSTLCLRKFSAHLVPHRFLGSVGGASQGWHVTDGCPMPLVPRVGDCPGRDWPSGFVVRSGHLRLGNYCGYPPQFNLNLGGSRPHTDTDSRTVTFSSS